MKKLETKPKAHRHKWRDHDCNCERCDYMGMQECSGCNKWRDEEGKIYDW